MAIGDYLTKSWKDFTSFRQLDSTNYQILTTPRLIQKFEMRDMVGVLKWTARALLGGPSIERRFLEDLQQEARIHIQAIRLHTLGEISLVGFWKTCGAGEENGWSNQDYIHEFIRDRNTIEVLLELGYVEWKQPIHLNRQIVLSWHRVLAFEIGTFQQEGVRNSVSEELLEFSLLVQHLRCVRMRDSRVLEFTFRHLTPYFDEILSSTPYEFAQHCSNNDIATVLRNIKAATSLFVHMRGLAQTLLVPIHPSDF